MSMGFLPPLVEQILWYSMIASVSFALFITASWGVYEHFYQKKMAELRMEALEDKNGEKA